MTAYLRRPDLLDEGGSPLAGCLGSIWVSPGLAVEIAHLRKAYGAVVAVDGISFTVADGEIAGILGPNGAGKTTTAECVIGLRRPDAGRVRVLGLDPLADGARLHEVVGVQLQAGQLPARLRVREILQLYRSFYRDPADAGELLEVFGLAGKRDAFYGSLSGGLKQRLSIALALIGRPTVAVLDETPADQPRRIGPQVGTEVVWIDSVTPSDGGRSGENARRADRCGFRVALLTVTTRP
jgi:ABC-type branched-subunit amino acid transport system ATPase component